MKKLILLLSVFALVSVSCSSDDDDSGSSQDQFIGNWKYSQYLVDGTAQELLPCEELGTIVISSNGTYTSKDYEDFGDGCELDYTGNGTWEKISSGVYSATEDGQTVTIEVGFSGNTMYFDDVDEGVTYRDVYVRQ